MRLRPRTVTLLAALVAGGVTDLFVGVPSLRFAYRSVPLHAMLETAATLIAVLTAFLLWGRLRKRRGLDDLLLFVALGVISFTNLFFAAIPAATSPRPHPFSTWTTMAGSALGAALLAFAALVPRAQLTNFRTAVRLAVAGAAAVLFLLGTVVQALGDRLPVGLNPALSPTNNHGVVVGHAVIVISQIVIALLFALAAYGFTRRAEGEGDELLLWLGAGAAVAAVARLNYFMFPSLYSEWVYTGDAFRLAWHVLLFVGAVREIQVYQRGYADSRVLEERRRIARDLHDGLAQELAFVVNASRELELGSPQQQSLRRIASAAQRGLDESRRAIATLSRRDDEPFDLALVQTVEEVAQRLGARVEITAEPATEISPQVQEELLRIVREAVTNAGRHADADVIRVSCTNGGPLHLRVEDDGTGFDAAAKDGGGFGLTTMRERAAAIGAEFWINSRRGRGTAVEVRL